MEDPHSRDNPRRYGSDKGESTQVSEAFDCLSLARSDFEPRLDDPEFSKSFEGPLDAYRQFIREAIEGTFQSPPVSEFLTGRRVELLTWHYRTRHREATGEGIHGWITAQVFLASLRDSAMQHPFPQSRSPYIGFFKKVRYHSEQGIKGPPIIWLPAEEEHATAPPAAGILVIPPDITRQLVHLPEYDQGSESAFSEEQRAVIRREPWYRDTLATWFDNVGAEVGASPEDNARKLQACTKVTLRIIRADLAEASRKGASRSTFLSPVWVSDDEVGGIAFACAGLIERADAYVGDAIAHAILSYVRLREDAFVREAWRRSEALAQAKRFFVRRLAHDLRHPIANVLSIFSGLRKDIDRMNDQFVYLNRVVDETLKAVSAEEPMKLLEPRLNEDRLGDFLDDVRFAFQKRFEAAGKGLEVGTGDLPRDTWIMLDKGMVSEILENLIGNALEHGGATTGVSAAAEGRHLKITVSDDGPGISDSAILALLERGSRVIVPGGLAGSARGFGLSIARLLAEAHGGTLAYMGGSPPSRWTCNLVLDLPNAIKENSCDPSRPGQP